MASSIRYDALRSSAFGSITTSFTALGAIFGHAMRILHFVNDTDGDVLISFDGITDNIFIPAGSFALYDLTSDEDAGETIRIQNRSQVYVKYSTAPTSGAVYLICIYAKGD